MTLRLAEIGARIESIRQLGAVVNAMRGIAAARARQARSQLGAVDNYAAVIADGIGRTLALMPLPAEPTKPDRIPGLIVFAAEQGFAGAFSERVFDFIGPSLFKARLFLIGTRGCTVLSGRGLTPTWLGPLPSRSAGIPKLADGISQAIYSHIASGEIARLDVVFTQAEPGHPAQVQRRTLLPLDAIACSLTDNSDPPITNLEAEDLLAGLTDDYFHAKLCHAALHAFAAENEARMEAMAAAEDHVLRQLAVLSVTEQQVRQEEITAEVIELAAGAPANAE